MPDGFKVVGTVERREADEVAVGYPFDLKLSRLRVISEANPTGGELHTFTAYRPEDGGDTPVTLATVPAKGRRRR